ncbi:putative ATP-dependent zinc protease [Halocatena halophila]|uniref:putative ATP-dependent zinc protease n=1 Tax=Halocatena halophila TaxID=2814576 RepID=UPI002ED55251
MNSGGDSDVVRVGVLALHNSKETKSILNAIEALGHEPVWLRGENTTIAIDDGSIDLEPAVDVIVNRLLLSNSEAPIEELGLAQTLAEIRPMLNQPAAVLTAVHKFATATKLTAWDSPVPDALLALSNERLNDDRERFGAIGVYKTAIGTHGGGTWKVDLTDPVNPRVGNRQAFLQSLIEEEDTRHSDLRIYIVDGHIVGTMRRYAPDGDWRTNVALGGTVEDETTTLPEPAAKIALYTAEVMDLDYAGVDLVGDGDRWYVLEVNPTAGFKGLFAATGRSPAPYIAQLALERGGVSIDTERVHELSSTLDDSTPSCIPDRYRSRSETASIIGYIEEVVVSGTSGSTTTLAKSDTGATRTSIDTSLAADIGAGPIKAKTRVKSGSVKGGTVRPVVDLVIGIGGRQHTVTASVEDRSHMDYPLLLGRDILKHYQVNVRRRADGDSVSPSADDEAEE